VSGFAELLCNGLIVFTRCLEKNVASARLGSGDAMSVKEGLELGVCPCVENPFLGVFPAISSLVGILSKRLLYPDVPI
jgi:hypothetical protein